MSTSPHPDSRPLAIRAATHLRPGSLAAFVIAGVLAGCTDDGLAPTDIRQDAAADVDNGDTDPADVPVPDGITVTAIEPAEGPTEGLVQTEIRGHHLSRVTTVYFGAVPALDVFPVNDELLVLLTPPQPAGWVDVRLETGVEGELPVVVERAYLYRDTVQVVAVDPPSGHPMGGDRVTISGRGFTAGAHVLFGTRHAVAIDIIDDATIGCVVPPGTAGIVDVHVTTPFGAGTLRRGYTYEGDALPTGSATIESVTPAQGPVAGGTRVTLRGRDFPNQAAVRVGALPATRVEVSSDARSLTFTTPPGSAGPNDVHVLHAGTAVTARNAFTYITEGPELYAVLPGRGATAGGTRVRLIGAGLPTTGRMDVTFGTRPARETRGGDGTWIDVVTPEGPVGAVDVGLGLTSGTVTLRRAFAYFDPGSRPGTWGGPVDGNVNVTVVDARQGTPIEGAFVMLGTSPFGTRFRGTTNRFGQIVFSDAGLMGRQLVTASRSGYQTLHLGGFDAENITVPLERAPTCEDVEDMPCDVVAPPPVSATFEGTIIGSSKGPSLPFGRCGDWSDTPGGLCAPCTTATTCALGDATAACLPLGNEGSFCTNRCETQADCGSGFVCLDPTGADTDRRCVPPPGTPAVFCDITEPSINATDTVSWPGVEVGADNRVEFQTRLGQYGVYCWGGTIVRGGFTPERLGVVRGLSAERDGTVVKADIRLDIPLSEEVTLVLDRPTIGRSASFLEGDRAMLRTFLDLGGDGVAEFPPLRAVTVRTFRQRVPARLSGPLYDATWTLLAGVESPALNGGSMLIERNLKTLQAAFDYRLKTAEPWEVLPATMDTTWALARWRTADGANRTLAVGDDGRIAQQVGAGAWARMTTDSRAALRAIATAPASADDGLVHAIAGGAEGTALHWSGLRWEVRPTGTENVFTSIVFDSATTAWATAGDLVMRWDGTAWTSAWTAPRPLAAIGLLPDLRVIVAGEDGFVAAGNDSTAFETIAVPTTVDLHAIAIDAAGTVDLVGDDGVWLHGNLVSGLALLATPGVQDLRAVTSNLDPAQGAAAAVGADAVVWFRNGTAILASNPGAARGTLRAVVDTDAGLLAMGSYERIVGPMMGIPENVTPPNGGFMTDAITWTAREGLVPHFNVIDFEGSVGPCSACGFLFMLPFTEWRAVTNGIMNRADFPDLSGISGVQPLSWGIKNIAIQRVRVDDGFDFDNSAASGFFGADWRAWAWRYVVVLN